MAAVLGLSFVAYSRTYGKLAAAYSGKNVVNKIEQILCLVVVYSRTHLPQGQVQVVGHGVPIGVLPGVRGRKHHVPPEGMERGGTSIYANI